MLAAQFTEATAAARHSGVLDNIARLLWRAHGEGHLADAETEAIAEAVKARRRALATPAMPMPMPMPGRRPAPRSPNRRASLERRRRMATSGVVPAKIASAFTVGELAVLTVVGRQCQRGGTCTLPIDAIAALAGVCRTTAQNALRLAKSQGLILVRERRRRGLASLTNVITVISREWLTWLKLGAGGVRGVGYKNLNTTNIQVESSVKSPLAHGKLGAILNGAGRVVSAGVGYR
jgi:hypothetical protein